MEGHHKQEVPSLQHSITGTDWLCNMLTGTVVGVITGAPQIIASYVIRGDFSC